MTAGGDHDETDPLIGVVLAGRYRIEDQLGAGAMGAVYRARHVKVGRPFAVKVLHRGVLADDKVHRRFQREAELAGKLHHINVVGVVDVGETEDGVHFMVMEYADGPTLGSLMQGAMDPERVVGLTMQLLEGLQHAHAHGLVHRDFKPENVIVELDREGNERPRIVDFGIALLREQASAPGREDRLTTAGLVLGTPHYMAPELAMGDGVDHRIDLFALGVTLYEMLTGKLPYDGDGVDVARANLLHATPPMGTRVPTVTVDPLLEAFTRRLMEKKPDDRPPTAKAARELLALIDTDRRAAARALGVELAASTAVEPPIATAPTVAIPPAEPRPAAPSTARVRGTRTRSIAIAAGLAVAVAAIAAITIASKSGRGDERIAAAPVVVTPDAAPVAVDIDASIAAAVEPPPLRPPPVDAGAEVAPPRPARGKPVKPRPARPGRPAFVDTPPDTSAAAVASLYGQVGRELKALDTAKGPGATSGLWPTYLRIRINDALATPEKRVEAHRVLALLRREIAGQP